jgi:Leishmanolysin
MKFTGIGTLWESLGVTGPDSENCPYRGEKAISEFQAISGCGVVPTENDFGPGTFCGHWDEECMGTELMTGYSNATNLLSRITIASLDDLGYDVDYTNADNYTSNNLNPNCRCRRRRNLMNMAHGETYQFDYQVSGEQRRRLSDEAYDMATLYGTKILSDRQASGSLFVNNSFIIDTNPDIQYVGDKVIVVFVMENDNIFDVTVRADA